MSSLNRPDLKEAASYLSSGEGIGITIGRLALLSTTIGLIGCLVPNVFLVYVIGTTGGLVLGITALFYRFGRILGVLSILGSAILLTQFIRVLFQGGLMGDR